MTAIDSSMLPKTKNSDVSTPTPTIWSTLNDNNLATPDIYQIKQSGTINSITNFANTFSTELNNIITGGTHALNRIKEGLAFYNNIKNTINTGTGLDKLTNLNTMLRSKIPNLPDDISNDIFNKIENTSDVLIKAGKTINRITNTNWNSINSVTSLLNELSGNGEELFDLSDLNTQGELLSVLSNQLSSLGVENPMDGIFKIIDKTAESKNNELSPIDGVSMSDYVRQNLTDIVVKGSLNDAIKNCNYKDIQTMAAKVGGNYLKTLNEDIVEKLSKNYKSEKSTNETASGTNTIIDDYKEFVDTALKIDACFFRTQLGSNDNVLDLSKISNGSNDFNKMIYSGAIVDDVDERNYLAWINVFTPVKENVKKSLTKSFPYTVWREDIVNID